MLKVTLMMPDGKRVLLIGLSFANLDVMRRNAIGVGATISETTFIQIDAAQLGLSHDVLIFTGETDADLGRVVEATGAQFTADTVVGIPDRMKN